MAESRAAIKRHSDDIEREFADAAGNVEEDEQYDEYDSDLDDDTDTDSDDEYRCGREQCQKRAKFADKQIHAYGQSSAAPKLCVTVIN
jgi:hypothetical protein